MKSLAVEERVSWLLSELRSSGSVTLGAASDSLGVSEMTVRRDLRLLESDGHARRVRGGAVFTGPVSFRGRDQSHGDEKRAIAEKLLTEIPASGMIAFDSSTTIYRLAALVVSAHDLVIVTNSVETHTVLRDKPGVRAILTGGEFDSRSDSLVGSVAASSVSDFTFSAFFASAASVDAESGCFEDTMEEADYKRAVVRSSARVIIGANSAKLGHRSAAASVRLGDIDVLCTEVDPAQGQLVPYAANVRRLL